MDAIEAGIVKVPRTPVDDDADDDLVPTCISGTTSVSTSPSVPPRMHVQDWLPPKSLKGLCGASTAATRRPTPVGRRSSRSYGETPPVFIVVCPNTAVSKLVFDWIAGEAVLDEDGGPSRTRRATSPSSATSLTGSRWLDRHDPRRLGAARVWRGSQGRLQEPPSWRSPSSRRSTAGATQEPTPGSSPTRISCAR